MNFISHLDAELTDAGLTPEMLSKEPKLIHEGDFANVYIKNFEQKAFAIKIIAASKRNNISKEKIQQQIKILEKIHQISIKPTSLTGYHGHFQTGSFPNPPSYCLVFDRYHSSFKEIFEKKREYPSFDHF